MYTLLQKVASHIFWFDTVKIMILSRYRYRPVTVPLPSRYHSLQALPIVHHRDTIVPDRPWLFLTVYKRLKLLLNDD